MPVLVLHTTRTVCSLQAVSYVTSVDTRCVIVIRLKPLIMCDKSVAGAVWDHYLPEHPLRAYAREGGGGGVGQSVKKKTLYLHRSLITCIGKLLLCTAEN